jgi:CRISPR system Cascade subunit CasE
MYFSLITAAGDQALPAAHERMDGPYADHQWLWHWFPAEVGTPRDFLFRRQDAEGPPRFYVVSERAPLPRLGAWQATTRAYVPQLKAGESLQFELRANPTVRHDRSGKSSRHDVVMEAKKKLLAERGFQRWAEWTEDRPVLHAVIHEACAHWLERRGSTSGFEMDSNSLMVEGYAQHREKRGGELRFTSVDLAGRLIVTDPTSFQSVLLQGLGRAKAFGCGLMLVRRNP